MLDVNEITSSAIYSSYPFHQLPRRTGDQSRRRDSCGHLCGEPGASRLHSRTGPDFLSGPRAGPSQRVCAAIARARATLASTCSLRRAADKLGLWVCAQQVPCGQGNLARPALWICCGKAVSMRALRLDPRGGPQASVNGLTECFVAHSGRCPPEIILFVSNS